MKTRFLVSVVLLAIGLSISAKAAYAAKTPKPVSAKKWETLADAALAAMKQRAQDLKMTGVAQVSYAEGDTVHGKQRQWDGVSGIHIRNLTRLCDGSTHFPNLRQKFSRNLRPAIANSFHCPP